MSTFIVRIELHPSDPDQSHSGVHAAMADAGFSRIHTDADGVRYHLPSFEYCLATTGTAQNVRDLTLAALRPAATHFMLLVSDARHIAFSGLVPVVDKTAHAPPLPAAASSTYRFPVRAA